MIPVQLQPEPASFDVKVRQAGNQAYQNDRQKAVANGTDPDKDKLPSTWRKCLDDLYAAYGGICVFLAIRLRPATGAYTVEHFVPKSADPTKAYEWSNFRLATARINSAKREFRDVLDPFAIQPGWFALDITSMSVIPGDKLDNPTGEAVKRTIERLKLNAPKCRTERDSIYNAFLMHKNLDVLMSDSPFIYQEHQRQGMNVAFSTLTSTVPAKPMLGRKARHV